jgi:hypothetical protein
MVFTVNVYKDINSKYTKIIYSTDFYDKQKALEFKSGQEQKGYSADLKEYVI